MRSIATKLIVGTFLLTGFSRPSFTEDMRVDCPSPPGGDVLCEQAQVAVCERDSQGAIHGQCYTKKGTSKGALLAEEILLMIAKDVFTREDRLNAKNILKEGVWKAKNGSTYRIKVSVEISERLNNN